MSNWGWVAFAFTVTYTSMTVYVFWLGRRLAVTKRRLEELT